MDKATKVTEVAELQQILGGVSSVVLTEYCGLKVETMTALRRALRDAKVGYRVVKNTLMRLAIQGTPLANLSDLLTGPIGVAYPLEDDPAAPAKACLEFAKKQDKFGVRAGWADGEVLDAAGVKALSTLPGKNEVRAQFLALLTQVPQQFLATLQAAQRDFLGVLNARKADMEEAA